MTHRSDGPESTLQLSAVRRIERAVEEFVAAWAAGLSPRIEDWLPHAPDPQRADLLEALLRAECRLRREAGEEPSASDYQNRFPSFPSAVARAIAPSPPVPSRSPLPPTEPIHSQISPASPTRLPATGAELPAGTRLAGRYLIKRVLGRGGFALVYEALDELLDRPVALKMPSVARFQDEKSLKAFVREARSAAKLYHPCVVQVHDVLQEPGHITIVQQFIDGPTLSRKMREDPLTPEQAVELLSGIADAVNYAHRHGFVHRDLKPANILLDSRGRPHVADFGLALHESVRAEHRGELAGTFPYMSPEQVRGEAHRLDGRSDIWSLGVIFYELLTRKRPFSGDPVSRLFDQIEHHEPVPPRQINPNLPRELARICLKCLAKQASARYETAADLVDDLNHWLRSSSSAGQPSPAGPDSVLGGRPAPLRIVPKGLRSFDASDADFFLELVPGPRDRDGLPDSLRFWKRQAESVDPDEAFSVGLMYGPSGSGKSSLIKAGLLPLLADHVAPIYIEATAAETEDRILRGLRRRVPSLPPNADMAEVLAGVRRGGGIDGRKVLLILDQFEQWLHVPRIREDEPLVRALRQCDGANLQTILLVRDDFWMSVTRFLRRLEIPQVEGKNSMAVDLFDADHARRVLLAFGQAYGRIPESGPGPEESAFVREAVAGLARDGRVVSVRLALFAEMMKRRPWTLAGLREVGGTSGVGVRFLEEAFSSRTAPPSRRIHLPAARAVLEALLPELGSNIKGRLQPESRLREASGYTRDDDFGRLVDLLDAELRLITPAESDGPPDDIPPQRHYQLTHDDLVPALRAWLTLGKKQTLRGRCQLTLAERTELWNLRPERKQLPTWIEWASILALTARSSWTDPQRRMMRAASRFHLARSATVLLALSLAAAGAAVGRRLLHDREKARWAAAQLDQLWTVRTQHLPKLLDDMQADVRAWRPTVQRVVADPSEPTERRVRATVALARLAPPSVEILAPFLESIPPEEQRFLLEELRKWGPRLSPRLWDDALTPDASDDVILGSAAALAAFDPDSPDWKLLAPRVARALVAADPLRVMTRVDQLNPVRRSLKPDLSLLFADPPEGDTRRLIAASILTRYAAADLSFLSPDELATLTLQADATQLPVLHHLLVRNADDLSRRLQRELDRRVPLSAGPVHEAAVSRQANAAQVLLKLGHEDAFWSQLRQTEDPRLRTLLIDRLHGSDLSWNKALSRLAAEPEPTIRQAILLGLDPYLSRLDPDSKSLLLHQLLRLHESDPDGGVHSAAEWLLSRWGDRPTLDAQKLRLTGPPSRQRDWYITPQGHTMIIIRPPGSFQIGSLEDEPWRDIQEIRRDVSIDYPFAVSAHEVTISQFLAFRPAHVYDPAVMPDPDSPAGSLSWFDAAAYCRWLSEQTDEPLDPNLLPYPPIASIVPGMTLPEDYLDREGYRLPTTIEWEYLARSRARTSRFFGNADELLGRYAWYGANSGERPWPVGRLMPSPLGLFDLYGNQMEWCNPPQSERINESAPALGGMFRHTPRFLRASMPNKSGVEEHFSFLGFRIVRRLRLP